MFFLDKPYVSSFLKATVQQAGIPVVQTKALADIDLPSGVRVLTPEDALAHAASSEATPIYMNSENAIGWLAQYPQFAELSARIDLFKDKVKFRERLRPLYPNFQFRALTLAEIGQVSFQALLQEGFAPPFILKPAVGFFSMGVHYIADEADWKKAQTAIQSEMAAVAGLYPTEVMDGRHFILEVCISGDEYAVDAYFDKQGNPVILGVLKHAFARADDVSDRVYMTSKAIIEETYSAILKFLTCLGQAFDVATFPVHVEIRINEAGVITPIEVNPMRFGGWCTTADLTARAYGFNPYIMYSEQTAPDWRRILSQKGDEIYALVVLDNSTGLSADEISAFDYDAVVAGLEMPLDVRKIDYRAYPVFGFLMTKTRPDNFAELERLLLSDLSGFVVRA